MHVLIKVYNVWCVLVINVMWSISHNPTLGIVHCDVCVVTWQHIDDDVYMWVMMLWLMHARGNMWMWFESHVINVNCAETVWQGVFCWCMLLFDIYTMPGICHVYDPTCVGHVLCSCVCELQHCGARFTKHACKYCQVVPIRTIWDDHDCDMCYVTVCSVKNVWVVMLKLCVYCRLHICMMFQTQVMDAYCTVLRMCMCQCIDDWRVPIWCVTVVMCV